MALIDVLPMFRYKPLDISPTPSKLAPKTGTTAAAVTPSITPAIKAEEKVELPQIVPDTTPTAPSTEIKVPYAEVQSYTGIILPKQYSALEPLSDALKSSTIPSDKARMAIIAQMGLERGWKMPSDFNLGNITAGSSWAGDTTTRGDRDARGNPITQKFRSYKSPKEFLDDYMSLLKNQYPVAYAALHDKDFNIDKFTSGLTEGKAKYAANPKYKETVKNVYNSVVKNTLKNKQ